MDIEGLVITRRHEANRIETCFSKPSRQCDHSRLQADHAGLEDTGETATAASASAGGVDMPSSFYVTDAKPWPTLSGAVP